MTEIYIAKTTADHVRELRETIRPADRQEIESFGYTCGKALWRSFKRSLITKTGLIDGKVGAIWGCGGTILGYTGQPWLLTSSEVYKIPPRKFVQIYRYEIEELLQDFPKLENYVSASYDESIRLLKMVGFTIGEPEKFGKGIFRKFTIERGQ